MSTDSPMEGFRAWVRRAGARRLVLLTVFVVFMATFAFVLFDPLLAHLGRRTLADAEMQLKRGDLDGCMRNCESVIIRIGNWWEPYWIRARAKLKKGDTQGALDDLNRCVEINPDIACVYALRGTLVSNPANALKDFDAALRLDAKDICTWKNRGIIRYRTKDYQGATEDLKRFLEFYARGKPSNFSVQQWDEMATTARACLAEAQRRGTHASSRPASQPASNPTTAPALESGK